MQLSHKVKLGEGPHGAAVLCIEEIHPHEALFRLTGRRSAKPHKYTIQLDRDIHIAPGKALWAMVNHACQPNCVIDTGQRRMVSRTSIRPGEELTFNYLTTEWHLASPFDCRCGAPHCPGTIRGFRHLDATRRDAIRAWLSPFLHRQLHAEANRDDGWLATHGSPA